MHVARLTAVASVWVLLAGAAHAQTISIGTSPVGSLNYSLGNALGKVMTDSGGLRARVVPFGGGQQFLPLIGKKELEMAIPSATDALFAYQGKGDFTGNPTSSLRTIGAVFPFTVGWFVKKDAPYQTLSDLKGKKVAVGFTANSAQHRIYLAGLAAEGLKESDFDGVPVPHVVRGVDDFMQGKVEATTFAAGAGKVSEANTKVGGIRYLNVPNTPEGLARVRDVMPTVYFAVLQPAPELAGILAPTNLLYEDYLVVAGAQMSDDDAYKIAKILYEDQAKLAAIAKTWGNYDKAGLTRNRGVPFHPGAIKFYQEKGIWPKQ
ncbi:MAG: TAXI family TRAP transporter solute-binding subunit [Xanthobacteraceae bacterium]